MKRSMEVFAPNGQLLNYQLTKTLNWNKALPFHKDSLTLPGSLSQKSYLYADIKPDEDRLLIYFWPYITSGTPSTEIVQNNAFFEDHMFSIALEDRTTLSFPSSSLHAGAMTLPIKIYIGGPDSVSAVQAGVSAGLYVGKKWSRTQYIKLPNEKEFTTYQTAYSLNVLLGLNKLDLDEKNTKDAGKKFKGSIASLSAGISPGFHYKSFTLFTAIGFDFPLSSKGEHWAFKGKPWIGLGAGFEIF
ncbi:hypothetical protein AAHN97_22655 [Chitinophaga niabensis]|uniref:hypothetical protein n=1 Tax=Chitinophaga niabensis TaxID=536979 RepID=UPI0031BAFF56